MGQNSKLRTMIWKFVVLVFLFHPGYAVTVDVSNQNLKTVPKTIDTSVTNLVLKKNSLIELNSSTFDIFMELCKLNLDHCGINYIFEGTLRYASEARNTLY